MLEAGKCIGAAALSTSARSRAAAAPCRVNVNARAAPSFRFAFRTGVRTAWLAGCSAIAPGEARGGRSGRATERGRKEGRTRAARGARRTPCVTLRHVFKSADPHSSSPGFESTFQHRYLSSSTARNPDVAAYGNGQWVASTALPQSCGSVPGGMVADTAQDLASYGSESMPPYIERR